jgi:hypothetical protein
LAHIISYLFIAHRLALNIGLFSNNLEFTTLVTAKAKNRKPCLRKIGIVKRDSIEGKDGLDEIIEANGFNKRRSMIIDNGFATFGNLLT